MPCGRTWWPTRTGSARRCSSWPLAAEQAREGRTLADRLDDLALAHGLHVTRERALLADGAAGLARLADAVERVRKEPPRLLAGQPVTVTDLRKAAPGVVDLAGGRAERSPGRPDSADGRPDLARRRRRPRDDPAEWYRACAQDLRRGRLARCGRGASLPPPGQAPPRTPNVCWRLPRPRLNQGSRETTSHDGERRHHPGRAGPDDRPHIAGARGHRRRRDPASAGGWPAGRGRGLRLAVPAAACPGSSGRLGLLWQR